MLVIAQLNHLRIAPRKVRLVADLIRGLKTTEAQSQLRFLNKKTAGPLAKLLDSALANAQHNFNLGKNNLYIAEIFVNEGPVLKRWRPRAFGRTSPIMKRTSRIRLVLGECLSTEKSIKEKIKEPDNTKPVEPKNILPSEAIKKMASKKGARPKPVAPSRPYDTTSVSKKRFFSRQTFGNIKKVFRRKSI